MACPSQNMVGSDESSDESDSFNESVHLEVTLSDDEDNNNNKVAKKPLSESELDSTLPFESDTSSIREYDSDMELDSNTEIYLTDSRCSSPPFGTPAYHEEDWYESGSEAGYDADVDISIVVELPSQLTGKSTNHPKRLYDPLMVIPFIR